MVLNNFTLGSLLVFFFALRSGHERERDEHNICRSQGEYSLPFSRSGWGDVVLPQPPETRGFGRPLLAVLPGRRDSWICRLPHLDVLTPRREGVRARVELDGQAVQAHFPRRLTASSSMLRDREVAPTTTTTIFRSVLSGNKQSRINDEVMDNARHT